MTTEVSAPECLAKAPRVSVKMITYNHARFIAAAVRSVLAQRVDFPVEVIIGDDCSTDGTRDILVALQREAPDRIRLLLHDPNLGAGGKLNGVAVTGACRGEYVAQLEGDDLWTCPDKLRRQVDLLDRNPHLAGCFHPVWFMDEAYQFVSRVHRPPVEKPEYRLEDFLGTNPAATCSVMFRRSAFPGYPDWYYRHLAGDWSIHLLNLHSGPYGYLSEVMGVYRIHGAGVWTATPGWRRMVMEGDFLGVLAGSLEARHRPALGRARRQRWFWGSRLALREGDRGEALRLLGRYVRSVPRPGDVRPSEVLHHLAGLFAPALLRLRGRSRAAG